MSRDHKPCLALVPVSRPSVRGAVRAEARPLKEAIRWRLSMTREPRLRNQRARCPSVCGECWPSACQIFLIRDVRCPQKTYQKPALESFPWVPKRRLRSIDWEEVVWSTCKVCEASEVMLRRFAPFLKSICTADTSRLQVGLCAGSRMTKSPRTDQSAQRLGRRTSDKRQRSRRIHKAGSLPEDTRAHLRRWTDISARQRAKVLEREWSD